MAPRTLVRSGRANAVLGWALLAVTILGAVGSLLADALLWGCFSIGLVVVTSAPAVVRRDPTAMVPWPLLLGAAVAVLARAAGLFPEAAGYLAIATLSLIVVVELDRFTPVALGRRFAVVFAVMTTMAIEALWIVAQFYADRWFGTAYLGTQTELQVDIVTVTAVGFAVGGLFFLFLERFEPAGAKPQSSDRVGTR